MKAFQVQDHLYSVTIGQTDKNLKITLCYIHVLKRIPIKFNKLKHYFCFSNA